MSLGLTILSMARLSEDSGFNNPLSGPRKVRAAVEQLTYSEALKSVILKTLEVDEKARPNFIELY
jgi:hypothetical protein